MHSCIYEGLVTHCRHQPVRHRFQYSVFMAYLDLAELPRLVGKGRLISARRFSARSFISQDHLFESTTTLEDQVRDIIRQRIGANLRGPIRLLTQLRYFGYFMSPLNLFYVYDELDQNVECVVAEVNNTPWKERHCYLLWQGDQTEEPHRRTYVHDKDFHVSPFMPMDCEYRWELTDPSTTLQVSLSNYRHQQQLFTARMTMSRRNLNRATLRRMAFRYPWMSAQIIGGIYFQACKLWWKKCPFHAHPRTTSVIPTTPDSLRQSPGGEP